MCITAFQVGKLVGESILIQNPLMLLLPSNLLQRASYTKHMVKDWWLHLGLFGSILQILPLRDERSWSLGFGIGQASHFERLWKAGDRAVTSLNTERIPCEAK